MAVSVLMRRGLLRIVGGENPSTSDCKGHDNLLSNLCKSRTMPCLMRGINPGIREKNGLDRSSLDASMSAHSLSNRFNRRPCAGGKEAGHAQGNVRIGVGGRFQRVGARPSAASVLRTTGSAERVFVRESVP